MTSRGGFSSLVIGALLVHFGFAKVASAEGSNIVTPPSKVEVGGLHAFTYKIAKVVITDIDKNLSDAGLNFEFCTFRQTTPAADFSYRGLGPCLLKSFFASMKTEQMAGSTYGWVKDSENHYHAIEIQWRPPRGGWFKLIKQVFEMYFEKGLYNLRSKTSGTESADKIRFQEFLGGELKIIMPEDFDAIAIMGPKGNSFVEAYLAKLQSISLRLAPTGREREKVVYTGKLTLEQKPGTNSILGSPEIGLRTTLNLVIIKRVFSIKLGVPSVNPPKFPDLGGIP